MHFHRQHRIAAPLLQSWLRFLLEPLLQALLHSTLPGFSPRRGFGLWRGWASALLLGAAFTALPGCQSLPSLDDRPSSHALPAPTEGKLAQLIARGAVTHPGQSGVLPLPDPRDAFAARILLARQAQRSIDAQYYIWRNDITGAMLLSELMQAAARGVRVRILLDDVNTSGLDEVLALVDAHPNVEVRLFNPFRTRRVRWLGYLTEFDRLNRRMHNKSYTVDNLATVIGGRNVGDEYFGAGEAIMFTDLDMVGVGPVVKDVSRQFDLYWASASSYPVRGFLETPSPEKAEQLRAMMHEREQTPLAQDYFEALRQSPLLQMAERGEVNGALEWTTVHMLSDDPAKGLGMAPPGSLLLERLMQSIGEPRFKVDLVSPYFVPTESGTHTFVKMARQGVKVRILTNSLESTDVAAVHAGYAKRRKELLKGGVTLYELKRSARGVAEPKSRRKSSGSSGIGSSGSSGSSLHAKTFAVDDAKVYVGSFNFDPRSARLNTEMGFLIDSPALARRMSDVFDTQVPEDSYQPKLDADGHLYWLEPRDDEVLRYQQEPGASWWRRTEIFLISPLPIESLL